MAFFNAVIIAGGSLTNLEKNVTNQLFFENDIKIISYDGENVVFPVLGADIDVIAFNKYINRIRKFIKITYRHFKYKNRKY